MKRRVIQNTVLLIIAFLISPTRAIDYEDSKGNMLPRRPELLFSTDSIVDPKIDWPLFYGMQQTGEINAYFDSRGSFIGGRTIPGWAIPEWPYASFEAPSGSGIEYLYGGQILVGGIIGDDTLVSTGWAEFMPLSNSLSNHYGTVERVPSNADFSMRAVFADTLPVNTSRLFYQEHCRFPQEHLPLNIKVVLSSHVWRESPGSECIIYDCIITNIGKETIEECVVGLSMDPDIGRGFNASTDDLAGSIPEEQIGYVIDNNGDPWGDSLIDTISPRRAFGISFLQSSIPFETVAFNWWRRGFFGEVPFSPRKRGTASDPYRDLLDAASYETGCDRDMYYILTHREWDYDQVLTKLIDPFDSTWMTPAPADRLLSKGADAKIILSGGTFDLMPDSSVRFFFTMMAPDSVIQRTDLDKIRELIPEFFSQTLYLSELVDARDVADSLSQYLLDPNQPVTGLTLLDNFADSMTVSWDPWVFDNIEGYDLYATEIDPNSLKYPGVRPIWYRPVSPQYFATVGNVSSQTLSNLKNDRYYALQVAHRFGGTGGQLSEPMIVKLNREVSSPEPQAEWVFADGGTPPVLRWSHPDISEIDHFNVYKFPDSDAARKRYLPFYDAGFASDSVPPADSILIGSRLYYYYGMIPYRELDAQHNYFMDDSFIEGEIYYVTAIDNFGFESQFSDPIMTIITPNKNREIVVLTYSSISENFVSYDSLEAFYNRVLSGYDFAVYNVSDSLSTTNCNGNSVDCLNWKDLAKFRLLIVDDGIRDAVITEFWEQETGGLTKYLLSGGTVAYFGAFGGLESYTLGFQPAWRKTGNSNLKRFFGIDSIFYVGAGYFLTNETPPYKDTLFGFSDAIPALGTAPHLSVDFARDPYTSEKYMFWPDSTPPSVAAFVPIERTTVTHLFGTGAPSGSIIQGKPVGLHYDNDGIESWSFGFHLWYMKEVEARTLIEMIYGPAGSCCRARSGNIDQDDDNIIDINDLTTLIRYLFLGNSSLDCPPAANTDGDINGEIDIGDLQRLIFYLFGSGPPPAACME